MTSIGCCLARQDRGGRLWSENLPPALFLGWFVEAFTADLASSALAAVSERRLCKLCSGSTSTLLLLKTVTEEQALSGSTVGEERLQQLVLCTLGTSAIQKWTRQMKPGGGGGGGYGRDMDTQAPASEATHRHSMG